MNQRRTFTPGLAIGRLVLATAISTFAPQAAAQATEGTQATAGDQTTPGEVSQEARDQARRHYRAGRRQLEHNHPEEALEEFAEAYALYPHWATSNGMGVCHDKLGRPTEALRLYEQALREGGDDIPEAQRAEIQARIDALRIQLGVREPTTGLIRVTTTPFGATIALDGTEVGVTPMDLEAPPGEHRVDVTLDGYLANGVDVMVSLGQTSVVALAMEAAPVVAQNGRLICVSEPSGARVLLDGTEVGVAPLTLSTVAAGEHVVRFEMNDGRTMEEVVTLVQDGTARVDVSFGGAVEQVWFWGLASAALVLGAGAAGTGAYGTLLWDEFNDPATERARQEDIQPTGRTMMLTTDILASAAGAFAFAAFVVAFYTDFGGEPESTVLYEGPQPPAPSPTIEDLSAPPAAEAEVAVSAR
jgi:hypothetical protein